MLIKRTDFWVVIALVVILITLFSGDKNEKRSFEEVKTEWGQKLESLFSTNKNPSSTSSNKTEKTKDSQERFFAKIFNSSNSKKDSSSNSISKEKKDVYGNLVTEPDELARVIEEFRKAQGDSLVIYQILVIYPEHLFFIRRDPKIPENIDQYSWYKNKGWQKPKPAKTPSESDFKRHLTDLGGVDFKMIPTLAELGVSELKKQGLVDAKANYIVLSRKDYRGDNREPSIRIYYKGERKDGTVEFDQKGNIIKSSLN